MRLCASPSTPGPTRCLGSWSTWVATECTFIAPARAAPRWSSSQVRAGPPPTLVGSRPPWPGTAQCVYMTGLVGGGYQVVCVNTSKEVSTDDGCRDESAGAGRAGAGDGGGAGRGGQVGPGRFAGRVDGPSRRGLIAIDRGGRVFAGAGEAGVGGGPGRGADRPSGL